MALVSVRLPSLLTSLLDVPRSLPISAKTLQEAFDNLSRDFQPLRLHLFDESGAFREHVLCFLNATNTRDLDASNHRLNDGDVITILQAVSGG